MKELSQFAIRANPDFGLHDEELHYLVDNTLLPQYQQPIIGIGKKIHCDHYEGVCLENMAKALQFTTGK